MDTISCIVSFWVVLKPRVEYFGPVPSPGSVVRLAGSLLHCECGASTRITTWVEGDKRRERTVVFLRLLCRELLRYPSVWWSN
jgi:NAD-dependent SIR2 family protein deacetylase